jgi:ribose transport system ATP-binding protein
MQGITKSFFGVEVLKGVDFALEHGEVHVLLGENGAGKSTLMKILSGAYTLDGGTITVDGKEVDPASLGPRAAEDLGVVTVYQNFHLIPHLSVAENLAMHRFTHERGFIRWNEVYADASEALKRIDFDIDLRTKVRDLPVSQKQMLEIAVALSKNARILILDEPTAALSRKETETLFKTLREVKARGIGIIYISHKLEEVKVIGDRITILRDGVTVATLDAGEADLNNVISLMIGKELSHRAAVHSMASGNALFHVEGMSSRKFPVPISFKVNKGEVLGITGLVGAGKTELARALFGVDRLSEGKTYMRQRPVQVDSPRRAIALGMGYLPEDRDAQGLCLNMGVKENVSMVYLAKQRGSFFSVANEKRVVEGLVNSIGLRAASLGQHVKFLSGGNKQKVVFGKWLTADCNLLVLDEPTVGIDVGARGEIYDLIRGFVAEEERAVIFISSDMQEVIDVSDRILVLARGQIVAELDPKTTSKQEILQHCLAAATESVDEVATGPATHPEEMTAGT